MSTRVLLTNTYFYRFDPKQWKMAQPYPPLGTIYAAAQLRREGYEVSLLDTCLRSDPADIKEYLQHKPRYLIIYDDGFNYLTKMCLSRMKEAAFDMIRYGKEAGCTVMISSSDSTDHYQSYLDAGADYVIHGEGEQTVIELLSYLELGKEQKPDHILGISYKTDDYHKNPGRPVLRDLDQLASPAWDLIDVEPYRKIWMDKHGYFSLNIATTRGCPYKCNWCAKPIYGNRYNSRSPERVIDEIEDLVNRFDVHYFWMCDDIFGLKPNWVQRFRDLKKERGLDFQYKIQSRVDLMLAEDNLEALADSGAHEVWVGAESGSQKILDAMDKGTAVSQIFEATRKLKKQGVRVAFFLQFGYLGETMEDIRKTINMVLDLMPDNIGISVSYPLPGTKFYERVKLDMITKTNWVDSDDLDLMFSNTYPPLFYKVLHRYVHDRYRIKKGWYSILKVLRSPIRDMKQNAANIVKMVYHMPQAVFRGIALKRLSSTTSTT